MCWVCADRKAWSVHEPNANKKSENLNMTIEWEESRWFLRKEMPYIPSRIANVDRVIAVGGFSKSPAVHVPIPIFQDSR